jgi:hypothetical protein
MPPKYDEERLDALLSIFFATYVDEFDETIDVVAPDDVLIELRSYLEKHGATEGTRLVQAGTKYIKVSYRVELTDDDSL